MIEKIARALARHQNFSHFGIDADTGWEQFLPSAKFTVEEIPELNNSATPQPNIKPRLVLAGD